jgi:pyruvate,water dikinase
VTAKATRYPNPLDSVSAPTTQWTRVNVGEACPGVVTPLSWDVAIRGGEHGIRWSFYDRGVLARSEVRPPADTGQWIMATFLGRLAVNVDVMRGLFERIPGLSGDDFEFSLLGSVRPDAPRNTTTRRYRYIAAREPVLREQIERHAVALYQRVKPWWRAMVAPKMLADVEGARRRWIRANTVFVRGARTITSVSNFANESLAALGRACAGVARPDLMGQINGGYGDTHDAQMSRAMWQLAHGRLPPEVFLLDYGYQGHRAADLAAIVWREDPGRLQPALDALAQLPEEAGPEVTGPARTASRRQAETELLRLVGADERAAVERVIADVHRFTVLRELVKAVSQRSLDVARAAARTIGADLVARKVLDEPDDIFYLLGSEFVSGPESDLRDRVAFRRERAAAYERVDVPMSFVGNPEPIPMTTDQPDASTTVLGGIGVSAGVVEGRVRVITDPATSDPLEPAEILVCETTDPSWVGHFLVAAGLVIDLGGPMSHGAIVARELGVPCVINTIRGTTQLRTGDVVRVDGGSGTVEVLERAPPEVTAADGPGPYTLRAPVVTSDAAPDLPTSRGEA